jgi:hypothetical protein
MLKTAHSLNQNLADGEAKGNLRIPICQLNKGCVNVASTGKCVCRQLVGKCISHMVVFLPEKCCY